MVNFLWEFLFQTADFSRRIRPFFAGAAAFSSADLPIASERNRFYKIFIIGINKLW